MAAIRRLFWDIETSPNVGFFWRCGYKLKISHENLIHERAIITIAWKWEGESRVHAAAWDKNQCDRALLREFLPVLNIADESVAHFGDSFDLPWVRTRALFHKLGPLPFHKTVDTLQWARRRFMFNSNKLDYIARFLGIGCKLRTDYDLWVDIVLRRNPRSLAYMIKYNKADVTLLEKVYHALAGYCPPKTHVGILNGNDKWSCPRCASVNVGPFQRCVTAAGTHQMKMKCRDCGGYYRISDSALRKHEEAKSPAKAA